MKPELYSQNKSFLKPTRLLIIISTVLTGVALTGLTSVYVLQYQRNSQAPPPSPVTTTPPKIAVSALGHLRPEGEVVNLSTPTTINGLGGSRVGKLLVKEGDKVKAGQVIAILDNHQNLLASLKLANEQVKVAQANLAIVKAGAKRGELEAQKATIEGLGAELQGQLIATDQTIARLEAEFNTAKAEYERYNKLFANGAVAASQIDSKQLAMKSALQEVLEAKANRNRIEATTTRQIKAAEATLEKMAEVRPTDVQAAKAEINKALANVSKVQADLELAYIRAPINGQILKIHTRAGETVGNKGIVALGQTNRMNAIAEVYELDVSKVRVGQKATITSNVFSDKLYGRVAQIGLQINSQGVLSTDPTADVNRRIVEVKIHLDPKSSLKASALTNLQVNILIDI
ncbi:DevB family ABC exporter membrane fusion protein [Rivularia sp. IAM M-261]|nr:DevB family ABC exporter membrane fusion protein [Calothrix sp. PCC 7716]GJD16751.1 DevB family ABC exporter membrane fusion protein [Rivularia sp. IAM M-261]